MLARAKKALYAAGGAFVTGLIAAAVQKGGVPGAAEIGAALGVGVATGIATYWAKNAPPAPPAGVTGTKVNELSK